MTGCHSMQAQSLQLFNLQLKQFIQTRSRHDVIDAELIGCAY